MHLHGQGILRIISNMCAWQLCSPLVRDDELLRWNVGRVSGRPDGVDVAAYKPDDDAAEQEKETLSDGRSLGRRERARD